MNNAHLNKLYYLSLTKQVNKLMKSNKEFVNEFRLLLIKYGVKI